MTRSAAGRLRGAVAGLCLACLAVAARAEPVTLSPDQLRVLAAEAVLAGRPETAEALSGALLSRDPDDVQALLTLSRARRDMGDFDGARRAGLAAWRLGRTADDRHAAALAVAQALSSQGARTRSQIWLRRAIQVAPDPRQEARAIRDYRYVRSRNPWSTQLRFAVAPSSNVNGGSSNERVDLYLGETSLGELFLPGAVLGPMARALSGVEVEAGINLSRRIFETARRRTSLEFGTLHRTFALSEAARDLAPGARGSDFAYGTKTLGVTHRWRGPDGRLELTFGTALQDTRYGGAPLARGLRAEAAARYAVDGRTALSASVVGNREFGRGTRADVDGWRLSAGLSRTLDAGHRLDATLIRSERSSRAGALDFTETEGQLGWVLGRPVAGAWVAFGLSAAARHYDRVSFARDGRDDLRSGARVILTLPAFDYYGFVPDLTFEASRTASSVDLYDREELGVSLGIRSRF